LGARGLFGGKTQKVGEIAGHSILAQDFQKKLDVARAEYEAQSGQGANDQVLAQLRDKVWNDLLIEYAYQKEFDALGLTLSDAEKTDMFFGKYIDPTVRQSFTDPQTGIFDKNRVIQQRNQIQKLPAGSIQQLGWQAFVRDVQQNHIMNRYVNLIRLSTYVTTAEARKDYVAQTAKVDARYLYVPFYSIADSTIKVTDSQLQDYLNAHKDEYKGANTRSLDYVAFGVVPSKADSMALKNSLTQVAKDLAKATNDSSFARMNSDVPHPTYWSVRDMDDQLKEAVKTFFPGQIAGPYRTDNTYTIYKYSGTKKDSLYTVKASHILIRPTNQSDTAKVAARKKAEDILKQLKGGADFVAMAAQYGTDGTAQRGGDLGYFQNNGSMVKPFETAIFGFSGTGLLPNVVETDFGYHIIKVTEAKDNTLYRVIAVSKQLGPSQATRDEMYRKADAFAAANKTLAQMEEAVKKDKSLVLLKANRIPEGSTNLNMMQNAQSVIRWAFDDKTDDGDVSPVFEVGDAYVLATLTGKTSEDEVKVDDFRDELTAKVRNDLKAEEILKKLSGLAANANLEQVAQKYGAGALVETVNDLTLANGLLTSAGADPTALGKAFGMKPGQKSQPFKGEGGVFIMETIKKTDAPNIADYAQYKKTGEQNVLQRAGYFVNEAVRDHAKVKDYRAKYY
ncbi:MAG: peptidylprolyl isomerase, partial [Siphonobacter sp.]